MITVHLSEQADRWTLQVGGAAITRVCFDWAVSLTVGTTGAALEIRIEQPFSLVDTEGTRIILDPERDPAELAPVLHICRIGTVRLEAMKAGSLELELVNGSILNVPPVRDYEAWTLAGPKGLKLVCMPGGKVAVWSAGAT